MSEGTVSKEFLEAITKYADCPEEVFKLANTDYERAVAVELFKNAKEHSLIKNEIKHTAWLAKLILGGTGIIGICLVVKIALDYIFAGLL